MPTPVRCSFAVVGTVLAAVVLSVGTAALAQGVAPAPATLSEGSEVVVTDRHGEHLLGYGRVEQRALRLSIAPHDDDDRLAVMLISPDGEVSTLVGRFADGGLRVRAPGTATDVTLLAWMSDRGVTLTLERVARAGDDDTDDDAEDDTDDDRDDDRGEAPPNAPSDDDGGDDPGDDADDDEADEDDADDDDADEDDADEDDDVAD